MQYRRGNLSLLRAHLARFLPIYRSFWLNVGEEHHLPGYPAVHYARLGSTPTPESRSRGRASPHDSSPTRGRREKKEREREREREREKKRGRTREKREKRGKGGQCTRCGDLRPRSSLRCWTPLDEPRGLRNFVRRQSSVFPDFDRLQIYKVTIYSLACCARVHTHTHIHTHTKSFQSYPIFPIQKKSLHVTTIITTTIIIIKIKKRKKKKNARVSSHVSRLTRVRNSSSFGQRPSCDIQNLLGAPHRNAIAVL